MASDGTSKMSEIVSGSCDGNHANPPSLSLTSSPTFPQAPLRIPFLLTSQRKCNMSHRNSSSYFFISAVLLPTSETILSSFSLFSTEEMLYCLRSSLPPLLEPPFLQCIFFLSYIFFLTLSWALPLDQGLQISLCMRLPYVLSTLLKQVLEVCSLITEEYHCSSQLRTLG